MDSLPSSWRVVRLGEAIELAYGKGLPKNERVHGKVPVYGSNGIAGWNDTALVNDRTIIVGRKGSAGVVQFVEKPCYPIDTTYFVRVRPAFSFQLRFLFYLLRKLDLSRLKTATGVPGLTREDAYKELIPVPPLDEQQRLVHILSRAEGIVRLQKQAAEKAREIIPALFLDLFGDPAAATNPRGWTLVHVSEFVSRLEGGKNLQAGSEQDGGFRILKVSAVTSGVYRESESKPVPDGYTPPPAHFVKAGDLLFSRANTEELVGATVLVESTNGRTLLPDKAWRFIWSRPVEPRFIWALFQTQHVRRELGKLSTGTSASMRNISQAKLLGLRVFMAPLALQQGFSDRIDQIRSIQSQTTRALETAEAAFQSVVHRAFAGRV